MISGSVEYIASHTKDEDRAVPECGPKGGAVECRKNGVVEGARMKRRVQSRLKAH